MKIKITEFRSLKPAGFRFPLSAFPRAERGLALVITLILLSVTLVMTIAFLALSKRERASVSTSTDTTVARLAADSALAAAQAQILANIFTTNAALFNYHLLVSTNYINSYGFVPNSVSPTNVNFDYYYNNPNLVVGGDFNQSVANLLFLPRAPVLVNPRGGETNGRFYLDLNRNGVFEDTGEAVNEVEVNASGNGFTNGAISQVGDPQWVGILERPGTTHAADNKFVSRYAFIALPVGESLDLNAIHNQVLNLPLGTSDGYFRNQGVGSWEINLAAFLADLNTNQWDSPTLLNNANNPYFYQQWLTTPFANTGAAFEDARAILNWRYAGVYGNLASANFIFGNGPAAGLQHNNIDEYGDGPLQISTPNINESLAGNADNTALSWAGANNPNQYFALPSELFDPTKSSGGVTGGFTNHLLNAGNTITPDGARPTYDRYTYYRMLDQLGTDTIPADDRLNLNYSNAVVQLDANGAFVSATIVPGAETNLVSWTPTNFFFAAADRLLKTYTTNWFHKDPSNFLATYYRITGAAANYYHQDGFGNVITNDPTGFGLTNIPYFGMTNQLPAFGLGNIPVLVSNTFVYSPSINRLLQLAANIYDASTNDFYPHVFRPIFWVTNQYGMNDVYIRGYEEVINVAGIADPRLARPIFITEIASLFPGLMVTNVYGVPWIIGAKKGLPSFNQFVTRNDVELTRKLQVRRAKAEAYTAATAGDFQTNQMYTMKITGHMGFSFWNSYSNNYVSANQLTVVVKDQASMVLSNGVNSGIPGGGLWPSSAPVNFFFQTNNFSSWPGSAWDMTQDPGARNANDDSFIYGVFDFQYLPESTYRFADGTFVPTASNPNFETNLSVSLPPFPQFNLMTTNGVQAYILDGTKVIDYVQLSGPDNTRDLNSEIRDDPKYAFNNVAPYRVWLTNGPNMGVYNQVQVSKTGPSVAPSTYKWIPPANVPAGAKSPDGEAAYFASFFTYAKWQYGGKVYPTNTELTAQAPFTPTRNAYDYTIWQANDPIVHFLATDLSEVTADTGLHISDDPTPQSTQPVPSYTTYLNKVTARYQPWGRDDQLKGIIGDNRFQYNLAIKDPLVYGPDNWDFPTNHYPSAGWLGRVHRGTPWQTIYLKATNVLEYATTDNNGDVQPIGRTAWNNWLGDFDNYDSGNSRPIQDALLFDIFTASPHPNATRGALSVNQTHLASWSALLSGMMVITNITDVPDYKVPPILTNVVIDPAGLNNVDSPLWQIVWGADGINNTRTNKNIFADGAFTRIGDILRVPALTEKSPFINRTGVVTGDDRMNMDISDEQYEWLPQQMLGLLRCSTAPRYVVYAYGQTLKPAVGGTVLDSSFFGLVTNYQVVAESATRAVLSVQPVVTTKIVNGVVVPTTNYTTRVESFNPLPPE